MVAQILRVIQSNEMGFPSALGNQCWSDLKSFTPKEEKSKSRKVRDIHSYEINPSIKRALQNAH